MCRELSAAYQGINVSELVSTRGGGVEGDMLVKLARQRVLVAQDEVHLVHLVAALVWPEHDHIGSVRAEGGRLEARLLCQQLDVGAAAVGAVVEPHLVPGPTQQQSESKK